MTWYDAEAFCQAFGGHLVELNTADEKSTVETMSTYVYRLSQFDLFRASQKAFKAS